MLSVAPLRKKLRVRGEKTHHNKSHDISVVVVAMATEKLYTVESWNFKIPYLKLSNQSFFCHIYKKRMAFSVATSPFFHTVAFCLCKEIKSRLLLFLCYYLPREPEN